MYFFELGSERVNLVVVACLKFLLIQVLTIHEKREESPVRICAAYQCPIFKQIGPQLLYGLPVLPVSTHRKNCELLTAHYICLLAPGRGQTFRTKTFTDF